jgi:hypothetical protein
MTEVKRPSKPSKKLSDITFEHDDAHIALVSKQQGGGAVGHNYAIVLKANKFSPESIQKMQAVRVTLDLPTFLEKFFGVYGSNAEILARMMGWVKEEDDEQEDEYDWEKEHQAYIEEKLASFEIMKSLKNGNQTILAELDEKQYLRLLRDQALVEKAFRKMDREAKKSETAAATAVEGATAATNKSVDKGEVEPPQKQEKNMEQVEELQKALDNQKVELEKALAQIAEFEKAKKEALVKAKTDKIAEAVQDEQLAAILVKAGLTLDSDEDFNTYVGAVRTLSEKIEKSALFREEGVSAHQEQKEVKKTSGVAAILEKKYNK